MKHLLPPVDTYYKANFHTHTTVSDGKLTPEQIRDAYKAKGYSILALTDHSVTVAHPQLNQEDFLLLTGVEVDFDDGDAPNGDVRGRACHLCLISKDPLRQWIPFKDPKPIPCSVQYEKDNEIAGFTREYSPENINAVIAESNRQGFLVTYNHPTWSQETYAEYAPLKGLWGMEYRNSASIAQGLDENNGRVYQDLLLQGNRLMPVCADDTHACSHKSSGYPVLGEAWNMVGARELSYDAVIEAMEKGELYASCGPEIRSLTLDEGRLCLICSAACRVQLLTHTRFSRLAASGDGQLTQASFDIRDWLKKNRDSADAFVRLIVTAADGSYAVTRAYRMDELEG